MSVKGAAATAVLRVRANPSRRGTARSIFDARRRIVQGLRLYFLRAGAIWAKVRRMSSRPEKHSLTLHGHRTSVSLEPPFWAGFCEIAAAGGLTINALAAEIDAGRSGDEGLASAIRVYVLNHYRAKAG